MHLRPLYDFESDFSWLEPRMPSEGELIEARIRSRARWERRRRMLKLRAAVFGWPGDRAARRVSRRDRPSGPRRT